MSPNLPARGNVAVVVAAVLATAWTLHPAPAFGQAIVNYPYSLIDLSAGSHRAGSAQTIWDVTAGAAAGSVVSVNNGHWSNSDLYYLGYIVDKSNTFDVTTGTWNAGGNSSHGYLSASYDAVHVSVTFAQPTKVGMMRFYPAGRIRTFTTDYEVSYQNQGLWQTLISRQTVTPSQVPSGTDAWQIFRDHAFPTVTAQNWRITLTNGEGGWENNATFGEIQFFDALDPGNRWAPGEGGGGSGTWTSTATNWAVSPGQRGNRQHAGSGTLMFGDTPGTVTIGDAVVATAGLQFAVDGYAVTGSHALTLGGASPTINLITADSGVNVSIDAVIAGSGGLNKAGSGLLALGGSNTYTGGTVVSEGRLVGNTASLRGALTNNAAVTFDQATSGTFASAISGSGSLRKTGNGTLTLTASNSYSGGTEVSAGALHGHALSIFGDVTNDAAVTFDQAEAGTYAGAMSGSGSLTKTGFSTLSMTGLHTFTGPLAIDAGTLTISGSGLLGSGSHAGGITIAAGARLVMGSAADQILAGNLAGSGGLVKSGSGRLTLSGTSTLSGSTTISAGTLALGQNASLANSSRITVGGSGSSNAVLDLTAKSGLFSFGPGQTLGGGGTVRVASSGTLGVLGTFAPGNSPGLFTYDGGTTLLSGTTVMEIFGGNRATLPSHDSGTFYDAVNVTNGGILDFTGGALRLTFSGTFASGKTFDLFDALDTSQLVGNFASVSVFGSYYTGPTWKKSGTVWRSSHTASGQQVRFNEATGLLVVVPEPDALTLAGLAIAAGGWSLCRRTRRAAGPSLNDQPRPRRSG